MSHDKLAYMANQIGKFFESQKTDTAVASIEEHLRRYWDPRMRRTIVANMRQGSIDLAPAVRQAVERLETPGSV